MSAQKTQTFTIHLDPDATTIHWTLKSFLHNARGSFKLKGGDVVINPKTGLAQGEVLVDATSLATTASSKQQAILDSRTYPAILFHPNKIAGIQAVEGPQQVQATGTLTLHGQDHPIDLPLILTIKGNAVTIDTHFSVPYVAWGLKDASSGITRYEKKIAVEVQAKGELKKELSSPAPSPGPDAQ